MALKLGGDSSVLDATVFKALIVPRGRGAFLKKRPQVDIARFDVVLLVEFVDLGAVQNFMATDHWAKAVISAEEKAYKTMKIAASNVRRIGSVDHSRDGVFLFNYFYSDSLDLNLKVWNYTAGWFQDQTGPDNSTVLLPDHAPDFSYTIVNHC